MSAGERKSKTSRRAGPAPQKVAEGIGARASNGVGRPRAGTFAVEAEATILRAALHLFAELGFAAVSTKDIAAAAGLNTALIYYYFGNKEDLYHRCVRVAADEATEAFADLNGDGPDADVTFSAWLDRHEDRFEEVKRLMQLCLSYGSVVPRNDDVDLSIATFHKSTRLLLTGALQRGVERRQFPSLNVNQTATLISRFLDGVYVRAILSPSPDTGEELAALRHFIRARLRAAA